MERLLQPLGHAGKQNNLLFPTQPRIYDGSRFVRWITLVLLAIVVFRSVIHLVAPATAAELIAGVDIYAGDGNNVVAMFSQWGAVQLILVMVLLLLFFIYPGLTPLVLLFLAMDAPLRFIAGQIAPLVTVREPPGQVLNWPYFFFVLVVLALSLRKHRPAALPAE